MGKRRIPEDVDYIATIKRFFDMEETEFDPAMREKLERLAFRRGANYKYSGKPRHG